MTDRSFGKALSQPFRPKSKDPSQRWWIQAEADAAAIVLRGEAQAKAQDKIGETLTPKYLQFRAFDSREGNFFFWPQGKDGMPIIVQPQTSKPAR